MNTQSLIDDLEMKIHKLKCQATLENDLDEAQRLVSLYLIYERRVIALNNLMRNTKEANGNRPGS